jgi:hypothetical protein
LKLSSREAIELVKSRKVITKTAVKILAFLF